jgi:maltooligosyltrehalose trehalohydrolase
LRIGAGYHSDGKCEFTVWAPLAGRVDLRICRPDSRTIPMSRDEWGYWSVTLEDIGPDTCYMYRLNESVDRADPASAYQPDGIVGPSQIIDHSDFDWQDGTWSCPSLDRMVIYELHVGTFTPEGSFEAIIPRLAELRNLGITAIELMPVAQFPGERNWGYDGVYPFAVQNSYGGPQGLRRLVNAAHKLGMAVLLDVVYNHIGCEGNHFADFGPYFTPQHSIRWGQALNFDGPHSDEVRNFFIENALSWFRDYHIDGLRLDAVDAIRDLSPKHFLCELAERTAELSRQTGRTLYLTAESDLNDARLLRPASEGGYGIYAQWCDDFHHALHAQLTDDRGGYYIDFGKLDHLAEALVQGFVYRGRYSAYKKRRHGSPTDGIAADQFIVFAHNHDQVGNRCKGDRLCGSAGFEAAKLAAAIVISSPFVPLLFMGEEYAEDAPFVFFSEHFDPATVDAVRRGRKHTLEHMGWHCDPPDPQSAETYVSCKLKWETRNEGNHKVMLDFYRTLLELRRTIPALASPDRCTIEVAQDSASRSLWVRRWRGTSNVFYLANFDTETVSLTPRLPDVTWVRVLDSADRRWLGPGSDTAEHPESGDRITVQPMSFVMYKSMTAEKGSEIK